MPSFKRRCAAGRVSLPAAILPNVNEVIAERDENALLTMSFDQRAPMKLFSVYTLPAHFKRRAARGIFSLSP